MAEGPEPPPNTACPLRVSTLGWNLGPLLGSRVCPRAPPPLDTSLLTPGVDAVLTELAPLPGMEFLSLFLIQSLPNSHLSILGTQLCLIPPSFPPRTPSLRLWALS